MADNSTTQESTLQKVLEQLQHAILMHAPTQKALDIVAGTMETVVEETKKTRADAGKSHNWNKKEGKLVESKTK